MRERRKMAKNVGTHQSHCCAQHGCKYGEKDCPVALHEVVQDFACEQCHSTAYLKDKIASLQNELAWSEKLEARGLTIFGYNEY